MNFNLKPTTAVKPGQVIIASPLMDEPVYKNAVVLIVSVTENGTTGIILNRPCSISATDLFREFPLNEKLFYGGPIQSTIVTFLHNHPGYDQSHQISKGLSWVPDGASISKIINDKKSENNHIRLYAGLTAWRNNELSSELKNNFWWLADISMEEIFSISSDILYPYLIKHNNLVLDNSVVNGQYLN